LEKESKPFKSLSIDQIENAIANAISELTNTEVKVNIRSLKDETDKVLSALSGRERFELSVNLEVGVSYTYGLEQNPDGSFNL